jgi:hypothetical protein
LTGRIDKRGALSGQPPAALAASARTSTAPHGEYRQVFYCPSTRQGLLATASRVRANLMSDCIRHPAVALRLFR